MTRLLIKGGTTVTLGEHNRVLTGLGMAIEDGIIVDLAPLEGFEEGTFDEVIDAGTGVVIPGFINAHTHFYASFAAGLTKAEPAREFSQVLRNLWWRLDKQLTLEDCYYSALLACIDAIKHGTTTLIDHHASPMAVRGSLAQVAQAVLETGIRASLCYEISDRDGPEIAMAGIEENADFIKNGCRHQRLHGLFGLHASFTIGDRTLDRAVSTGTGLGVGFHIHAAEALHDQTQTQNNHGAKVIPRLHRAGVLGPGTICAHCVFVDEEELRILRESDTIVTHQPQSNMNNGVGTFDLLRAMGSGVLVGLGTDAMTVDMLEELRAAIWLQRLEKRNPSLAFNEAVTTLTRNNALIAGRFWEPGPGELRAGAPADIAILDYDPATPLDETSFSGHLVFGMPRAQVDTTICAGRVLMRGKQLLGIDEAAVKARARELAAALWARF